MDNIKDAISGYLQSLKKHNETTSKLKRRGNSYGVIATKEMTQKESLKEGETVEISVRKTADVRKLFGKYLFRGLQEQKDAMRKDWNNP